ncbi:MAG: hypothetical protein ACRD1Y_08510 [Terriglobales bacterium]
MTERWRALLEGAIDYAGVFPPAEMEMAQAVGNYRRYLAGESRWALGRFVCPVGRLGEFAAARGSGGESWAVSAVGSGDAHEEAAAIARFNQDYYGRARVVAIEAKTPDAEAVSERVKASAGLECYCEMNATSPEFRATLRAAAEAGARAKLRTGGTTAAAIPTVETVLDFMLACRKAGLAFKATAGLHHAWRGEYALTYQPEAERASMHGFANVALAAIILADGGEAEAARQALADGGGEGSLERWQPEQIAAGRRFFLGFGSCSFEDPLQERAA